MASSRCRVVPITLTFDALETVIQVTGGAGYQYWCAARQFLSTPSASTSSVAAREPSQSALDAFNASTITIIRDAMKSTRQTWSRQHPDEDPKTMPIGGENDQTLIAFWQLVLGRVFTELELPDLSEAERTRLRTLAASGAITRTDDAAPAHSDDVWDAFVHTVVFERFGSTQAHSWLPAGERTLRSLRDWNARQWQHVHTRVRAGASVDLWSPHAATTPISPSAARDGEAASGAVTPILVLARPPALVSNMDPRLRLVMRQLGAMTDKTIAPVVSSSPSSSSTWRAYAEDPECAQAWPLVSEVITGRDAGRAKPSPAGLLLAAKHAGIDHAQLPRSLSPLLHIHVGDADADRLACKAVPCRYVRCDGRVGVEWEPLSDALTHLEASWSAYLNACV